MEKLDKYIKECNLVFTDTIDRLDFCRVGFDIDKTEVNYEGSINLWQFVSSFNKLYLAFKKDYDELEKLSLGKKIKVLNFNKFGFDNDEYRVLRIYIDEPTITKHEDTVLYLREINGEMKPFVTNDINPFDKSYYYEEVELDNEHAKKYLDLFEKHSLLLETYKYLRNNQLFGDGTNCIFTSIDDRKSNLLEGLKNMRLSFSSLYFDTEYYVEFLINLGENFGIDYDNCKMVLDCKETNANNADYDSAIKNVFVNEKYTRERRK